LTRKPLLIGIDIGTTSLKAAAYDQFGHPVARSQVRTPTYYPHPGWAYYQPDEIWNLVASLLREVIAAIETHYEIAGLAIASMAEAGVPLDKEGGWVYPIISWFDKRTQEQVEWWQAEVGPDRVFSITGLPLMPIWSLNKIMWLRSHEPSAYERMTTWLNMADYVTFKLSGVQATDYSLACRTMALDLETMSWSEDLIRLAGVRPELFPRLVSSGELLGYVTEQASKVTGLPAGTPVVSGGHDHLCGALAAGVIQAGDLLDSMGTSEALLMPLDRPVLQPEIGRAGYAQGAHVVSNCYYIMGGLYTSGASVDWFMEQILPSDNRSYDALLTLAAQAPPGSLGVFFVPHLRLGSPPHYDPKARGAFIGLSTDVNRSSLARALFEGLAYEAFLSMTTMAEMVKTPIERIVLIGGGTRNNLLLEIKATVADRALQVVEVEEATTLGAALLAGIGIGLYRDAADAQMCLRHNQRLIQPDPALVSFYRNQYRTVYMCIYETLRPLHHTISEHFGFTPV